MTNVYCEQHTLPGGSEGAYLICADGHATGSQEACAAVSGLLYALSGYFLNNASCIQAFENILLSGHARLRWQGGVEAKAVFDLCVIGFLQIAAAHPACISVKRSKK